MVAALACLCCFLGFCALICCRSGDREEEEDVREEKAANVHNVFAEVKEESVKDEKPLYNTISDQMKALEKQNELLLGEISYLKKIVNLMEEKNMKKSPVKRAKK